MGESLEVGEGNRGDVVGTCYSARGRWGHILCNHMGRNMGCGGDGDTGHHKVGKGHTGHNRPPDDMGGGRGGPSGLGGTAGDGGGDEEGVEGKRGHEGNHTSLDCEAWGGNDPGSQHNPTACHTRILPHGNAHTPAAGGGVGTCRGLRDLSGGPGSPLGASWAASHGREAGMTPPPLMQIPAPRQLVFLEVHPCWWWEEAHSLSRLPSCLSRRAGRETRNHLFPLAGGRPALA